MAADKKPGKDRTDDRSDRDRADRDRADRKRKVEKTVRRYYAALADLDPSRDELTDLLAKKATIIDHPSAINPNGTVRSRRELLEERASAAELLTDQHFELHEILVSGDSAAVRATWRVTLRDPAGRLPAGHELLADIAAFLVIEDGQVVRHESFDCFQPIAR